MKNSKPVLVVVYNHKYPQNVPIINQIYNNRFSRIYHLMPFYDKSMRNDGDENIIPVYDNSLYFHGYMYQGLSSYYKPDASHYIFVADDMMLNPLINEDNYAKYFKLSRDAGFIHNLKLIEDILFIKNGRNWLNAYRAYQFNRKQYGLEELKHLPSFAEALERIKKSRLNPNIDDLNNYDQNFSFFFQGESAMLTREGTKEVLVRWIRLIVRLINFIRPYKMSYPLIGGLSDIVIVPQFLINKFCHYCGIFAASNLFVEIAIPTVMILTHDNINLSNDLNYKCADQNSPLDKHKSASR